MDPVSRFRKWIESNGWWSNEAEAELRSRLRKQVYFVFRIKSFQRRTHTPTCTCAHTRETTSIYEQKIEKQEQKGQ